MIDAAVVGEIIETYKKHGWILRRILLSAASRKGFNETAFGNAGIFDSKIDAAWFARPPKDEGTAWEIRYLGNMPYALVETINEKSDEFEQTLSEIEARLVEKVTSLPTKN